MEKDEKVTVLQATQEEYDAFMEEIIQGATDESTEPIYRVHFVCMECRTPWYYDTAMISQAGLRAVNEGCPLCKRRDNIALTSHELLIKEEENIPDINEFVRIGVF